MAELSIFEEKTSIYSKISIVSGNNNNFIIFILHDLTITFMQSI